MAVLPLFLIKESVLSRLPPRPTTAVIASVPERRATAAGSFQASLCSLILPSPVITTPQLSLRRLNPAGPPHEAKNSIRTPVVVTLVSRDRTSSRFRASRSMLCTNRVSPSRRKRSGPSSWGRSPGARCQYLLSLIQQTMWDYVGWDNPSLTVHQPRPP